MTAWPTAEELKEEARKCGCLCMEASVCMHDASCAGPREHVVQAASRHLRGVDVSLLDVATDAGEGRCHLGVTLQWTSIVRTRVTHSL